MSFTCENVHFLVLSFHLWFMFTSHTTFFSSDVKILGHKYKIFHRTYNILFRCESVIFTCLSLYCDIVCAVTLFVGLFTICLHT